MRLSTFIIGLVLCLQGFSQSSASSPYTRFGIGNLNSSGLASTHGMGGFGAAFAPTGQLNLINPATFSLLTQHKPVFDLGVHYKYLRLETTEAHDELINVALRNVAFGFPIGKRGGFGFGLQPYSSVGYSIVNEQTITDIGDVQYEYEGDGGLNRVYFGGAYRILNTENSIISVGATASYMFGSISNTGKTVFPNGAGYYNTRVENSLIINDFKFDVGLYYQGMINDQLWVHTGVVFNSASELNARKDFLSVNYIAPFGEFNPITVDTIEHVDSAAGHIKLPMGLNYGLALDIRPKGEGDQRLLIGLDYKLQDWSKYEEVFGSDVQTDLLKNSYQFSVGLQYSPVMDKVNNCDVNFFKLIDYRAGFRYNSTYLQLEETELTELGISFGIGIPVSSCNTPAVINLGAEFGERGTTDNNLIKEQFASVYLGLSLSPWRTNGWFVKRKYD